MPLVNYSLPNLLQGVSQQPDPLRYDGQCESQLNMYPSIVEGLTRRPYSEWLYALEESAVNIGELPEGSFVHFITSRANEKYVLIHTGTDLYVYNLSDGTLADILVGGSGTGSYAIPADSYLDVGDEDPIDVLRVMTIGDNTFLVNKNWYIGADQDVSPALEKEALIWVKQGDYEKDYTVTITGQFGGTETSGVTASVSITWASGSSGRPRKYFWYISAMTVDVAGSGYELGQIDFDISVVGFKQIGDKPSFEYTLDGSGGIATMTPVQYGWGRWEADGAPGTAPAVGSIGMSRPTQLTSAAGTGVYIASKTSGTTASATNVDTSVIAGLLEVELEAVITSGADFVAYGNLIVMTKEAISGNIDEFDIRSSDGLGDRGLAVAYKEVDKITDLPVYAKNNFRIKVRGDIETDVDDYWVIFKTRDGAGIGEGSWLETNAPNTLLSLTQDSMPRRLTLTDLNTFSLSELPIAARLVGDDTTNPFPSFLGNKINNLFFFKDRLGFISGGNISMTESGIGPIDNGELKYNWLRATVSSLLDSAPIDTQVISKKVVNIEHAVTTQDRLMLFADGQQFILKGSDILSSSTVEVSPVTNFAIDPNVTPLEVGAHIYFPFDRGAFAGLREMDIDLDAEVYRGEEITKQVPRYIPQGVRISAGSTTENVMLFNSPTNPHEIFCNRFHWDGPTKVLNSWGKFDLPMQLRGIEFVDSDAYLVGNLPSSTDLELTTGPDATVETSDPFVYRQTINFLAAHGLSVGDKFYLKDFDSTFPTPEGLLMHLVEDAYLGAAEVTVDLVSDATSVSILIPRDELVFNAVTEPATAFSVAYETHVLKMNFQSAGKDTIGYTNYQDFRYLTTVLATISVIPLPYPSTWIKDIQLIDARTGEDWTSVISSVAGSTVTLTGGYFKDRELYVGFNFKSEYVFSEQLFKAPQGQSTTPVLSSKMRIRRGKLMVTESDDFTIAVTPHGRVVRESNIDASTKRGAEAFGEFPTRLLHSGEVGFPVKSRGADTEIKITTETAFPLNLQSAEFEVLVEATSERYGR